jgi:hypothetical protein
MFTGRVNDVDATLIDYFASPSGTSVATGIERDVETLAPGRGCMAQDLSVRLTEPPGGAASVGVTLRVGGSDTVLSCAVVGPGTTCSSSSLVPVPQGATLSIKILSIGALSRLAVLFGWACL